MERASHQRVITTRWWRLGRARTRAGEKNYQRVITTRWWLEQGGPGQGRPTNECCKLVGGGWGGRGPGLGRITTNMSLRLVVEAGRGRATSVSVRDNKGKIDVHTSKIVAAVTSQLSIWAGMAYINRYLRWPMLNLCCERHPIPSGYGFDCKQGRTWTTTVQVVKGKENPMRHIGANKFVMHRTLD